MSVYCVEGSTMAKQQSVSSISSASENVYSNASTYVPDFTVKSMTDMQYLRIRRGQYVAARRATMMERHPRTPDFDNTNEDPFTKEWKRAMDAATPPPGLDTSSTSNANSISKLNSPSLDGDIARTRSDTQASSEDADGEAMHVDSPLMTAHKPNSDPTSKPDPKA